MIAFVESSCLGVVNPVHADDIPRSLVLATIGVPVGVRVTGCHHHRGGASHDTLLDHTSSRHTPAPLPRRTEPSGEFADG